MCCLPTGVDGPLSAEALRPRTVLVEVLGAPALRSLDGGRRAVAADRLVTVLLARMCEAEGPRVGGALPLPPPAEVGRVLTTTDAGLWALLSGGWWLSFLTGSCAAGAFCFLEREVERPSTGAWTDVGRVEGLTGRRLGEALREGWAVEAAGSAVSGFVGLRRERVRWRDDMAAF